jgi:hypothetical protein
MKRRILLFSLLLAAFLLNAASAQTTEAPANLGAPQAGTADNPYQIATLGNLYWIAATGTVDGLTTGARWSSHYIQTAHINAAATADWFDGAGWLPIGGTFTGSYNGGGHAIDGLVINRPGQAYRGLFSITNGAEISHLGLINVNISVSSYSGPLVGLAENNTIISGCYATGTLISSATYVGGLVGANNGSTTTNSYSMVSVTAAAPYPGGLVSINEEAFAEPGAEPDYYSTIRNSYSTGLVTISGTGTPRGLVGTNVPGSTVANSFWDVLTSGTTFSAGGTGKSTTQMKDIATFVSAGWDISHPEDDAETVWLIANPASGYISYPYLRLNVQDPLPGHDESPAYNATQSKFYLSVQAALNDADPGDRIVFEGVFDALATDGEGVVLAPGSSPGCATFLAGYTLDNTITLEVDIDGLTPCTEHDQITVNGTATLGGANLVVVLGFAPTIGDVFEIILSDNPIAGTFAQGGEVTAEYNSETYTFTIAYTDNKVTLEVIPTEAAAVPLSNIALVLSLVLMGVFVRYRFA